MTAKSQIESCAYFEEMNLWLNLEGDITELSIFHAA